MNISRIKIILVFLSLKLLTVSNLWTLLSNLLLFMKNRSNRNIENKQYLVFEYIMLTTKISFPRSHRVIVRKFSNEISPRFANKYIWHFQYSIKKSTLPQLINQSNSKLLSNGNEWGYGKWTCKPNWGQSSTVGLLPSLILTV